MPGSLLRPSDSRSLQPKYFIGLAEWALTGIHLNLWMGPHQDPLCLQSTSESGMLFHIGSLWLSQWIFVCPLPKILSLTGFCQITLQREFLLLVRNLRSKLKILIFEQACYRRGLLRIPKPCSRMKNQMSVIPEHVSIEEFPDESCRKMDAKLSRDLELLHDIIDITPIARSGLGTTGLIRSPRQFLIRN